MLDPGRPRYKAERSSDRTEMSCRWPPVGQGVVYHDYCDYQNYRHNSDNSGIQCLRGTRAALGLPVWRLRTYPCTDLFLPGTGAW